MAIGFTFSVTGETIENLTDAQRSFLRSLFYNYLAAGGLLIIVGIVVGRTQIFGWRKNREKGQKTL